jgi:hypothetical protein
MARKRTSLDSILTPAARAGEQQPASPLLSTPKATQAEGRRPDVKQQTAYLPIKVHEQLRRLAFEERAKMHDYLLEGLDLVFRARGLPSISELTNRLAESEEE